MASERTDFEHLQLKVRLFGRARLRGGGTENERTKENKESAEKRQQHADALRGRIADVSNAYAGNVTQRRQRGLPDLPPAAPLLLQVDPETDIDYLRTSFGFEIVSEQEDGFVIVASEGADFNELLRKIEGFVRQQRGSGAVAKLYSMHGANESDLRLQRVLSEPLFLMWGQIQEQSDYVIDVGVECLGDVSVPPCPERREDEDEESWSQRLSRWAEKRTAAYIKWDEIKIKREGEIEEFVESYDGAILYMIDGETKALSILPDSFTARLRIKGAGLKDLALNFPYVFEIVEPPDVYNPRPTSQPRVTPGGVLQILPPTADAPRVCVIDSGIQEEHRLLQAAVDSANSHSYVSNDPGVADAVSPGGHGTRVAGAVLYPRNLPTVGQIQVPFWIQNARVLDSNNKLSNELFPPVLLAAIVDRYHREPNPTRIFNHSVSAFYPCRQRHMSSWAAAVDELSATKDVLFVQAAGNVLGDYGGPIRLGLKQHLLAGRAYPDCLLEASCRIPDPAQSFHALTVGSVAHAFYEQGGWRSFGGLNHPSAFSATGFGIWSVVKPDVVEYGGDWAFNVDRPTEFSTPEEICTPLVRSTRFAVGPDWARDDVGTSYAAPRVAHIAAKLQSAFPEDSALIYRALIAQSARWPDWAFSAPDDKLDQVLRHLGYGIPDLGRATVNNDFRVTLKTDGNARIKAKEAHVYRVTIPEEIRSPGLDHRVLVEVTLAYTSRPRRTRRQLRGYLSTWVDWKASDIGESAESFEGRVFYEGEGARDGVGVIPWFLGGRNNEGRIRGVRRSSGSLQKDWAFLRSYQLPDSFCIAVVGHAGWDNEPDADAKYALVVSIESLDKDVRIYEPIRVRLEAEVETALEVQV